MHDEAFRKKFGHTAMLWRGTEILRRNAKAAVDLKG
jgi:epoxyqueuosine reductase QueG